MLRFTKSFLHLYLTSIVVCFTRPWSINKILLKSQSLDSTLKDFRLHTSTILIRTSPPIPGHWVSAGVAIFMFTFYGIWHTPFIRTMYIYLNLYTAQQLRALLRSPAVAAWQWDFNSWPLTHFLSTRNAKGMHTPQSGARFNPEITLYWRNNTNHYTTAPLYHNSTPNIPFMPSYPEAFNLLSSSAFEVGTPFLERLLTLAFVYIIIIIILITEYIWVNSLYWVY